MMSKRRCWAAAVGCWLTVTGCQGQTFTLERGQDSTGVLTLTTDSTSERWPLPYPVYRMETGDVDGNGSEEALVGVVKATRFYPEKGRRLFIFKNYHGLIRPLWLGSRLGGQLCDFRFADGKVRSMELTTDGRYTVAEYHWSGFGLAFSRYVAKDVSREEAMRRFER